MEKSLLSLRMSMLKREQTRRCQELQKHEKHVAVMPELSLFFNPLRLKNIGFVSERDLATLKKHSLFNYCFHNNPLRVAG